MGIFGTTTFSGDRRTVRAALDADGYEDELSRSLSDQRSFVDQANADEVEICRVIKAWREAAEAACAKLDDARRRLAAEERPSRDLAFVAGGLANEAEASRKRMLVHCAEASEDRRRTAELTSMARVHDVADAGHDAMWAGFAAATDRLEAALREVAPSHPLLAPTGMSHDDGTAVTGFDAVALAAYDALAARYQIPTKGPVARDDA